METIKTDYPLLLNDLNNMRRSLYYAARKHTLHQALDTILGLEAENKKLKAKLAEKGKE